MMQAEQSFQILKESNAREEAVYEWTMARSYMLKAREEYSNAEYDRATQLSKEAMRWSEEAKKKLSPEDKTKKEDKGKSMEDSP